MTIPATSRVSPIYQGNTSANSFAFAYKTYAKQELQVIVSDGVTPQTLTLDSDYSVSLNADQVTTPGGVITYPITGSPLPLGKTLVVVSAVPNSQDASLPTGGAFNAAVVELGFDRQEVQLQQFNDTLNRTIRVPVGESISAPLPAALVRAGYMLGFDGLGNPIAVAPASGSAAALATDLASTSVASKGAGQTGFSSLLAYAANTVGAALKFVLGKLLEWPSVTSDYGAVGDGVTLDTAAFTAAQAASAFVYLPAGKTFRVGAGLNYWQFYGPGQVFENGKQWTVAPYPQSGQVGKFYNPRTFGIYEQAVALAVTINSGVGQTKENTQVLGTDTLGLAQTYTDRDHVAGYFSAYSYVPDVLDGTTTYTSTTLSNAAIGALNAAGKIKPGMIIDTLHATICTGRVQSIAGNVITVDVWYPRSGGGATTPANGTGAIINPNTKVFGRNTVVSASGNGTTTGANQCVGDEIDISTGGTVGSPQVSPRAGTLGHDFAVAQYSYADVIIRVRGQRNISFLSTNSGGAGLFGLVSIGDGRGVSVQDATSLAMEVLQGGITKFSVDPAGVVATPKIQSNAATLQGAISAQCTTAFVNVGVAATNGSLYFISGFNVSGGAQGAWLLMARSGVLTTISASDGSGNTVVFQVSGEQLQIKTTTGTFQFNVFQVSL